MKPIFIIGTILFCTLEIASKNEYTKTIKQKRHFSAKKRMLQVAQSIIEHFMHKKHCDELILGRGCKVDQRGHSAENCAARGGSQL